MTIGLFQGQLRGFKHAFNYIQNNLLQPLECKELIFYLPEEDRDKEIEKFIPNSFNTHIVYEKEIYHDEEGLLHTDNLSYNDKGIEYNKYTLRGRLQHYLIQLYNKKRVFEIYKNSFSNFSNHTILLMRPDLAPHIPINTAQLNLNCINVPNCPQWFGVYDRMCIGNFSNVETYSLLYDNIKNKPSFSHNNPESRLKFWLDYNNICTNIFQLGEVLRVSIDGTCRDS